MVVLLCKFKTPRRPENYSNRNKSGEKSAALNVTFDKGLLTAYSTVHS